MLQPEARGRGLGSREGGAGGRGGRGRVLRSPGRRLTGGGRPGTRPQPWGGRRPPRAGRGAQGGRAQGEGPGPHAARPRGAETALLPGPRGGLQGRPEEPRLGTRTRKALNNGRRRRGRGRGLKRSQGGSSFQNPPKTFSSAPTCQGKALGAPGRPERAAPRSARTPRRGLPPPAAGRRRALVRGEEQLRAAEPCWRRTLDQTRPAASRRTPALHVLHWPPVRTSETAAQRVEDPGPRFARRDSRDQPRGTCSGFSDTDPPLFGLEGLVPPACERPCSSPCALRVRLRAA